MSRLENLSVVGLPLAVTLGLATVIAPMTAEAFCGFYVAGAGADLYNQATVVVLMRDGTRTVLSMRNNYQGPPQDFALVVPVPVVLEKDDVQVIDSRVFDRVDRLSAPRLVEYWERDPCYVEPDWAEGEGACAGEAAEDSDGVRVEAKFAVGEYEIAILSARDSTGLETWLRREQYAIPSGAEPLLRPYVESGSKFFVAKVDASKVAFDEQGRTKLSPLRISYDSAEFSLPVRLGLINAGPDSKQDLLIHILARGNRYRVANYENVTIPTNLDVADEVRQNFGSFYASLFDHTLASHPNAVVTEYAWSAATCDPCPDEPLSLTELVTLGADLLPAYAKVFVNGRAPQEAEWKLPNEFVLTRLHARYDASSLGEDLVFEVAPPLVGGREFSGAGRTARARRDRSSERDQQLPGPLCDPASVDRAREVSDAELWRMGLQSSARARPERRSGVRATRRRSRRAGEQERRRADRQRGRSAAAATHTRAQRGRGRGRGRWRLGQRGWLRPLFDRRRSSRSARAARELRHARPARLEPIQAS